MKFNPPHQKTRISILESQNTVPVSFTLLEEGGGGGGWGGGRVCEKGGGGGVDFQERV